MMKRPFRSSGVILWLLTVILLSSCGKGIEHVENIGQRAEIFPDYYGLTLPPNIAPLNFVIREPGSRYRVEIKAGESESIVIAGRSSTIKIPLNEWQMLLSANAGEKLRVDIWSRREGKWYKYRAIEHRIATEAIDPYLAYRLVYATYLKWRDMGIYQRNLSNFEETPIIENSATEHGCMNCHSFANNNPDKMMIHFRILHPGTLIWSDGELSKVNTKTPGTLSAGIYPDWHPDGKHIAFSTGQISPHLTTRSDKVVDVADRASDLMIYDVVNNKVRTSPVVSTSRRENMPRWSPDGRTLYYLSAPEAIPGDDESLLHSRYSLMKVRYSTRGDKWGEPEVVVDADSLGMSISMPAISPNGRYMVCSMSDYGYFTIFHKHSELWLIELETGALKKLELNSGSAESFSSWSSNGHWLVFSSKRMDDVFSRPHIAYIDADGVAHKPFVLPQKNPEMYDRLLANYNLPKMITGKVDLTHGEIRDKVFEEAEPVR